MSDTYATHFDGGGPAPSIAVAETLETALDGKVDPLFDYVDPDALDTFVTEASEPVTVRFDVEDATVTVHGDGRVLVHT